MGAAPDAAPEHPGAGRWRGPLLAFGLPLVVVVLAGGLRLWGLGHPERQHFDEVYYAVHAEEYLDRGVETKRPAHPPLGKWMIAAGVAVLGRDPVGWRISAALAGTATVLLVFLAGRSLFRSTPAAALAALFVALDGISLTMSRIAMLDVFLALFVTAGFAILVLERSRGPSLVLRCAAGAAFGAAVATKWSGGLALLAAILVLAITDLVGERSAGRLSARTAARTAGRLTLPMVVVPVAVYVASYAGWFASYPAEGTTRHPCTEAGTCDTSAPGRIRALWDEHVAIVRFHRRLEATHPYRSAAVEWPVLGRSVLAYLERCRVGEEREADDPCVVRPGNEERIVVVGNPALWWPALVAYPLLLWWAFVRRRWIAAAIAAFLLLQWAPWLLTGKEGYLFYATPLVPFIALGLTYSLLQVPSRTARGVLCGVAGLAVVGMAVYLLPIWLGIELSESAIDARLFVSSWR